MRIQTFEGESFRNFERVKVELCDGVNVFCGRNGQGKTNLLEGMWLFTGAKSFRGAKNAELVRFGEKQGTLRAAFFAQEREQEARLTLTSEGRLAELNGVKKQSPSELIGTLCAVVFSPEHLSLVGGASSERRKFLDCAISQTKPSFMKLLVRYNRVLAQRNALLKEIKALRADVSELEVWNCQLSALGGELVEQRGRYISALSVHAGELYEGISGGRERLRLGYACSFLKTGLDRQELSTALYERLKSTVGSDVMLGYTNIGAHRDDINIELDGMPARQFASQGQKKSCVLALKLAEAAQARAAAGEQPVAVLDDVMSELDAGRQEYLLNRLTGWQVLITCCDPATLERMTGGRIFAVEAGKVTDVKELS